MFRKPVGPTIPRQTPSRLHLSAGRPRSGAVQSEEMSTQRRRWLAMALWSIAVSLAGTGAVFFILNAGTPTTMEIRGFRNLFAIETACVGLLIIWRRPDNPIGWLFSSLGLVVGIESFAAEYA